MPLELLIEDDRWVETGLEHLADRAFSMALTYLQLDPEACEVSLMACDDARIAALNADFRGKPQPTNVLSWPSEERGAAQDGGAPVPPQPDPTGELALGDIAIAYDTCLREAETAGKSLPDHATHLIVHGLLHLLGYDHIRDRDATLMEKTEAEILGRLGIDDPYYVD